MITGDQDALATPSVNSSSSTIKITASTSCHKNWHGTCWYPTIQRQVDLEWFQGDKDVSDTQRNWQARLWQVKQVPVMLIENSHGACLYIIFQRQIDLT